MAEKQYIYVINGMVDNLNFSPQIDKYEYSRETDHNIFVKCRGGETKFMKGKHGFKFERTEEDLKARLKIMKRTTIEFLRNRADKLEEVKNLSIYEVPAEFEKVCMNDIKL